MWAGSHYFAKLRVPLPRTELKKRLDHEEVMQSWYQDAPTEEAIALLSEDSAMLSTEVLATFDGRDPSVLGPYDQSMVPALWGTGWVGGKPP